LNGKSNNYLVREEVGSLSGLHTLVLIAVLALHCEINCDVMTEYVPVLQIKIIQFKSIL
jgi:hypothetical protein